MTNERFNLIALFVIIVFVVTGIVSTVLSDFRKQQLQELEEQRTEMLKEALKTGRPIVWIVNERCLAESIKETMDESL